MAEVDWASWVPHQLATVVFIIDGDRVLLIRNKRGLGQGKINGPGGRLDPGETALACAIREVEEEVGSSPIDPRLHGVLDFQFTFGLALRVHVFRADRYRGTPVETDEAVPLWVPLDGIPYDQMWADDRFWLPLLLERRHFSGRFLFDGDRLIDHQLDVDG